MKRKKLERREKMFITGCVISIVTQLLATRRVDVNERTVTKHSYSLL